MQTTKITKNVQKLLEGRITHDKVLKRALASLFRAGARVLLVGGAVRDLLLSKEAKDWDIEVHGIALEDLQDCLQTCGHVRVVGKQFGVLRIDGLDIDWSLPRTDSVGRKPTVAIDPHMSVEKAFERRDLTVNAMGIDLQTFELEDPFSGLHDLENKILRAPNNELFVEDPLRLFRVMQFTSRLEMSVHESLDDICKDMDVSGVSKERIVDEFEKLFLKSTRPSLGIRWLKKIDRLQEILPELYDTIGVVQDAIWHPEGDVFEHTMQTIDKAATLECADSEEKYILLLTLLCHDLGKIVTSKNVDGRIRSWNHEIEGVAFAQRLFRRICLKKKLEAPVLKLVRWHMVPGAFVANSAKAPAYKRLAKRLAPHTNIAMLCKVFEADKSGRNPEGTPFVECPDQSYKEFYRQAQKYGVLTEPEPPVLTGKDLESFVSEGPKMGKMLDLAYKWQIEKGVTDKAKLKDSLKISSRRC